MVAVGSLPRRLLIVAVLAIGLFSTSGCVPVTWLPDSSGFVYAKRHKAKNKDEPPAIQLVHFDLKKNAARVVVDRVVSNTNWPAVSPDGKRLAVARFAKGVKEGWTVQMVIYDLGGKQLHESKPFEWPARGIEYLEDPSLLFWSPNDDTVVVTTMRATGFYDLRADSMAWVKEGATPLIHGGTPIRPDGKGCLLLVSDGLGELLRFVQWDGTESALELKPLLALPPNKGGEADLFVLPQAPLVCPSWWDGNAAVVGSKRGQATIKYDTVKKTVASTAPKKDGNPFEQVIKAAFNTFDFSNDVSIRVVDLSEKEADAESAKECCRVVVVHHKTGKEHTLLAKEAPCVFAVPSPDGRYLALNFYGTKVVPRRTVVISDQGELVGKIDFPK